ncbi:MAG: phage Gp37/Gp68 family protein [Clostridiales bacterium]|jgi:protein gp37|nr:phage Gp37/Gp68 family protein [Clostridiales bacterium]
MAEKTRIEYCDSTWNPVTGCRHGCEYCYARDIARRFGGYDRAISDSLAISSEGREKSLNKLHGRLLRKTKKGKQAPAAYPFGFEPTLHRYTLSEPNGWKKPRTAFVGSMCDLFGDWVPDDWISDVLDACAAAPQHRYLFLTKNPERYGQLHERGELPPQHWYGMTLDHAPDGDSDESEWTLCPSIRQCFVSVEPLTENVVNRHFPVADWYIVGAMTGPGAKKSQPRPEWVREICEAADNAGVPVFMKDSLIPVVGEENMRRELPWER